MQSLIPPFDAYEGDKPYVFVSYAHKNSDIVYAHISKLHEAGFRIWYDEGIDPGADWSDEIAAALHGCAVFLVFISEASLASHNVRKEIIFAIDQRKHMLCVHIEEVELPLGLKMQLGNIQALLESRFHDKEKFYRRLHEGILPEQTMRAEGEEYAAVTTQQAVQHAAPISSTAFASRKNAKPKPAPSHAPNTSNRKLLVALLLILCVVAGACGSYLWMQHSGGESGNTIQVSDTALEKALREVLQKPHGELRSEDLASYSGQLDLAGMNITNIDLLRHMKGITILNLDDNNITDISPLAELTSLSMVGLAGNKITDVSPLHASKDSLMALSLDGNPLEDMLQLRAFRHLQVLSIRNVPITDVSLGRYLRRVKTVFVSTDSSAHKLSKEDFWAFTANLPPNCEVKKD